MKYWGILFHNSRGTVADLASRAHLLSQPNSPAEVRHLNDTRTLLTYHFDLPNTGDLLSQDTA